MAKTTIDNNKKIENSADKAQKSLINIDETVNDNLLQSLEKNKEPKKEKVTLEIDGQTIEGEKYYFEYPKYIQEETGILGYERTIIPEENLKIFEKGHKEAYYKKKDRIAKYYTKESYEISLEYDQGSFLKDKLLPYISKGEYPNKTINHIYSWYYNEIDADRHKTYFKNNNFFLEKIYDLEKMKMETMKRQYPFSRSGIEDEYSRLRANITIYDTDTDEQLSKEDRNPLYQVLHYKKEIEEGKVHAATTHSGLNMSGGGFFHDGLSSKNVAFGFSVKEPFLKEYLEQSFLHIIKNNSSEKEFGIRLKETGALALILLSLMINKMLQEGINIPIKDKDELTEEFKHYIKNEGIDYLTSIIKNNNLEKDFHKNTILNEKKVIEGIEFALFAQFKMPIFIGHPQIPQLSWGHAKYAHFFSEKGFNFFEFKHAEHIVKQKNTQK